MILSMSPGRSWPSGRMHTASAEPAEPEMTKIGSLFCLIQQRDMRSEERVERFCHSKKGRFSLNAHFRTAILNNHISHNSSTSTLDQFSVSTVDGTLMSAQLLPGFRG